MTSSSWMRGTLAWFIHQTNIYWEPTHCLWRCWDFNSGQDSQRPCCHGDWKSEINKAIQTVTRDIENPRAPSSAKAECICCLKNTHTHTQNKHFAKGSNFSINPKQQLERPWNGKWWGWMLPVTAGKSSWVNTETRTSQCETGHQYSKDVFCCHWKLHPDSGLPNGFK